MGYSAVGTKRPQIRCRKLKRPGQELDSCRLPTLLGMSMRSSAIHLGANGPRPEWSWSCDLGSRCTLSAVRSSKYLVVCGLSWSGLLSEKPGTGRRRQGQEKPERVIKRAQLPPRVLQSRCKTLPVIICTNVARTLEVYPTDNC